MNALTIGSYAAMAFMGILVALWLYRRGITTGEIRMEKRIEKVINEEYAELADKLFNRPDPFRLRDKPSQWRVVKTGKL